MNSSQFTFTQRQEISSQKQELESKRDILSRPENLQQLRDDVIRMPKREDLFRPREQLMDAYVVKGYAKIETSVAKKIAAGRSVDQAAFYFNMRGAHNGSSGFDWRRLGIASGAYFNGIPVVETMYRPVELPKEKPARKKTPKSTQHHELDEPEESVDDVRNGREIIRKGIALDQKFVEYIPVVIHPGSFTKFMVDMDIDSWEAAKARYSITTPVIAIKSYERNDRIAKATKAKPRVAVKRSRASSLTSTDEEDD